VKRTLVVFLAVLGFALAHTALAMAYWDYQGYLPSGGGPRSFYMHEYLGNNDYPVEVRMSWSSSPSHYMNFIYLHTDGSWEISVTTSTATDIRTMRMATPRSSSVARIPQANLRPT
jgi:hypothetical protein